MCFHSSALTVGMTKNGEISSTRTMPRPGNGSVEQEREQRCRSTTVIAITDADQQQRVAHRRARKPGR